MLVFLFFSMLALFFTYLESSGQIRHGLRIGIFLVTIIAAIRYNVGSDYWAYYYSYQDVISFEYSLSDIFRGELSYKGENGWFFLMYLLKPLGTSGFFIFVALISIFQGVVAYRLIKAYVPKEWQVFALYIYLFHLSLYVGSLSGIRQHLAMTIIACSVPYILKKKVLPSIIIILAASTIHMSSLIFLPFACWGFMPLKNTRYLAIIFAILYVVFQISSSLSASFVNNFLALKKFEHYETYLNDENSFFGWSYYIIQILLFIITLVYLYNNYGNETKRGVVSLVAAGMTLLPIFMSVHIGFRLFFYFEFIFIISIPIVYSGVKNKHFRISLIILYSLYLIYAYNAYFHSELRYSTTYFYHSLFDLI